MDFDGVEDVFQHFVCNEEANLLNKKKTAAFDPLLIYLFIYLFCPVTQLSC